MKRSNICISLIAALFTSSCACISQAQPEIPTSKTLELTDTFQPLFNGKDLTGWAANLGNRGNKHSQSIDEIFTANDGFIHVYAGATGGSKQFTATLVTEQAFSDYVFEIDYQWLGARFIPRHQADRDAGICFHVNSDFSKVWPPSIECQIGESEIGGKYVTGDLWVLGKAIRCEAVQKNDRYAPLSQGGQITLTGDNKPYGNSMTSIKAEKAGEWNTVRVIVQGGAYASFWVNDQLTNEIFNMQEKIDGQWVPLTQGRIALQAEFAEMYYRNPRIRKILPGDLASKPDLSDQ